MEGLQEKYKDQKNTRTELEKEFQGRSLRNINNGTWGAPFGGEGRGINGAAVPDMLHQYLLGVLRNAVRYVKEAIKAHGRTKGTRSAKQRFAVLDARFREFNTRHQGIILLFLLYVPPPLLVVNIFVVSIVIQMLGYRRNFLTKVFPR